MRVLDSFATTDSFPLECKDSPRASTAGPVPTLQGSRWPAVQGQGLASQLHEQRSLLVGGLKCPS